MERFVVVLLVRLCHCGRYIEMFSLLYENSSVIGIPTYLLICLHARCYHSKVSSVDLAGQVSVPLEHHSHEG